MFLLDNELEFDTYLSLRAAVGWKPLTKQQAIKALQHSLLTVVAYDGDKPVGMGRLALSSAIYRI